MPIDFANLQVLTYAYRPVPRPWWHREVAFGVVVDLGACRVVYYSPGVMLMFNYIRACMASLDRNQSSSHSQFPFC